eukprot:6195973-Pleurochrysis_carterae.AAC.2
MMYIRVCCVWLCKPSPRDQTKLAVAMTFPAGRRTLDLLSLKEYGISYTLSASAKADYSSTALMRCSVLSKSPYMTSSQAADRHLITSY